ncbi:radical SAM protein [Candidatus Binatia bacterium]|nr:radical SAM protein [Candidatus Binatia bacterium]
MPGYVMRSTRATPRLPLHGRFDLTYRCNLDCRHCWLRLPAGAPEKGRELDLTEIRDLADQARALGCREWSLSGGEPMLRADFAEIFDYLTAGGAPYRLNTNGTLITPAIARLLRRKGAKMIALYGATPEVCDHVTRLPGSFERTMRGIDCLREAGAGFTVQVVPMRDNFHQLDDMIGLAESLGRPWRIGAAWLYLSASGDEERNAEIRRQRLAPADVIALDKPDPSGGGDADGTVCAGAPQASCEGGRQEARTDDRLFASCIAGRRDFHVDPYGQLSFCSFVKDPALRYDLRRGTVREAWEVFVPGVAERARGGSEYVEHCATCALRSECRYCPVYGYLERRRPAAPVEYLCGVARESRRFKQDWRANHRRYYRVGGLTVQVDADLPFAADTFASNVEAFRVDGPGEDNIVIRHHFSLPSLDPAKLGVEVYRQPPWAIYRKGGAWIYVGISPAGGGAPPHRVAVFDRDHGRGRIYSPDGENFRKGGLHALTLLPTDQILLSRVLADRDGCFLHSSGAIVNGQGLLFVGHSGAGKSTMVKLLQASARNAEGQGGGVGAEILCDDRNIVRRYPDGFRVFGSWSHGEVPAVSTRSAPLRAILFLEQASENRAEPVQDRRDIARRLLACLIKPLQTADWWNKTMLLVEAMARQVPCYRLRFDRSGQVVALLDEMTGREIRGVEDVA